MKPSHLDDSQSIPLTFELVARCRELGYLDQFALLPECQVPLNLHQPDEDQPSQLLGTCDCCSRWFFIGGE